ncbi:MAG TPA: ATP-binding protein [Tepidisphaeraceae bacterium]
MRARFPAQRVLASVLSRGSIQRDLRLRLVTGVLALAAAAGAGIYLYVRVALRAQFDAGLSAKADVLSVLVERRRDGHLEFEFSPAAMPEFGPAGKTDFFEIRREDGSLFAASPSLRGKSLPAPKPRLNRAFNLKLPTGASGRALRLRFLPRPEVNEDGMAPALPTGPSMFLNLARDRGEIDRPLAVLLTALLVTAAALSLGTVLLVTVTLRRGLQPLRTLAGQAAEIDAETLDYRFPPEGLQEELQPICRRLNDLLGRLQAAFARERRFTSDAAHELRTPIAELRAMAEVALRWPSDPKAAEQNARDALAIAGQMESIVTSLLALARCNAGTQVLSPRPVDLSDMVRSAWRPLAADAAARGLYAHFDLPPSAPWQADPTLLGSILTNLLSNSVAHGAPDGPIDCRVVRDNGAFTLTIENANASLLPDDLPHLFESFWRKDAARADGRHAGLGLTLVAAYAQLLGLRLAADLPAGDRFRVTLTLPHDAA